MTTRFLLTSLLLALSTSGCDPATPPADAGGADGTSCGVEFCNGLDDDCDGTIDETSGPAPAPIEVRGSAVDALRYGVADGALGVLQRVGTELAFDRVEGDALRSGPNALALRTSEDVSTTSATLAPGCRRPTFTPALEGRPCVTAADCTVGSATECVSTPDGSFCDTPVVPRVPAPLPTDCAQHFECDDGVHCNGLERCEPRVLGADARGCVSGPPACASDAVCGESPPGCTSSFVTTCPTIDAAIGDRVEDTWLVAAVSSTGCAFGSLDVGYVLADTSGVERDLVVRGPAERSTSWLGIDVDGASCTGASRPATAPRGVAMPALATLASHDVHTRPQALVAWLAAPACRRDGCPAAEAGGTGPVSVEVIGVWLEEGLAGPTPIAWTLTSDDGRPTTVGTAIDGPAVVARGGSDDGYLVLWPVEGGGFHAVVLPALPDPAPVCESPAVPPCIAPVEPYGTLIDSFGGPRTTPALPAVVFEDDVADEATPVAAPALASGANGRVALAWAETDGVFFTELTVDTGVGSVLAGGRIHWPGAAPTDVAVVHVETGLRTSGATGGYVVTWRDSLGVRLARVLDDTHTTIDDRALLLGPGAEAPRAFETDGGIRVFASTGEALIVWPHACGTAP